jgi:hypothetical protein
MAANLIGRRGLVAYGRGSQSCENPTYKSSAPHKTSLVFPVRF